MLARPRLRMANDDQRLASSVRWLLCDERYDARITPAGEAVLQAPAEQPAELIQPDPFMPRLDGWGFLEKRALMRR